MTELEFNRLITRYQRGTASEEEVAIVEYWLEKRTEKDPYSKLSSLQKENYRQKNFVNMKSAIQGGGGSGISDEKRTFTISRRNWRGIAAAVLVLILGTSAFYYSELANEPEWKSIVNVDSEGGVEKIILSDGSIVWLKEDSEMKYPVDFSGNERRVILKGEALFEISEKKKEAGWFARLQGYEEMEQPFIVECGDIETRVLGTSFQISQQKGETEVYVLTGKVEVTLPRSKEIALQSNEKAIYRHEKKDLNKTTDQIIPLEKIRNRPEYQAIVQGTEYDLFFKNETLVNVTARIADKFEKEVLLDSNMNDCLIRADLTDRSLAETLDLITETLEATYEMNDDVIRIKGRGCEIR